MLIKKDLTNLIVGLYCFVYIYFFYIYFFCILVIIKLIAMAPYRDAGTGQYVSEEYAKKNPKTTVKETDKKSTPAPKKKKK